MDRREGRKGRVGLIWALMTRVWSATRTSHSENALCTQPRSQQSQLRPVPGLAPPHHSRVQPFSFLHHGRLRQHTGTHTCPPPLRSLLIVFPLQALHKSTPAFSPTIPTALLPYLAFFLLAATFGLAFYFSTYVPVSVFYPTHTLILMPLFATVCQKRRFPRASLPLRPQQAFWAGSAL